MKQKRHITGFYIETLLLILVFVSIILVITNIFGMARVSSARARHLTTAVALAQNTAEVNMNKRIVRLIIVAFLPFLVTRSHFPTALPIASDCALTFL